MIIKGGRKISKHINNLYSAEINTTHTLLHRSPYGAQGQQIVIKIIHSFFHSNNQLKIRVV